MLFMLVVESGWIRLKKRAMYHQLQISNFPQDDNRITVGTEAVFLVPYDVY